MNGEIPSIFKKKTDTLAYLCLKIEKDDMELQPQNKINWVGLIFGCLFSPKTFLGKSCQIKPELTHSY